MASIMKRGDSYSVRYKYKDHSGKPCEGWESFKTKKEAQERKITVEKELLDGTFLVPDTMTVEEMLYKWMMESEILAELQSKPLPDNVHAAFLKTCYNFADKMGLKLNLREHKQTHSYCWSTSSSSNVFYVDMNLKTYRCTCTVGRSRYSLFDFSYENLTNYRPVAVTCNSYAECKDCKIGGFCGGGCQLSHQIDFKKCCTYEEEVFSHFIKTLFIPYIKSKYNEVNQNERKAENRCT